MLTLHTLPYLQSPMNITTCSTLNSNLSNTLEDILRCAVSDAITDISASMAPSTNHFDQDPMLVVLTFFAVKIILVLSCNPFQHS